MAENGNSKAWIVAIVVAIALVIFLLIVWILVLVLGNQASNPWTYCGSSSHDISPPRVDNVSPSIICLDHLDSQSLVITGQFFLVWDNTPPIVKVNGISLSVTVGGDCSQPRNINGHQAQMCTQLTVTLNRQIPITSIFATIEVLDNGNYLNNTFCVAQRSDLLVFVPDSTLFSIFPPVICNPQSPGFRRSVVLSGVNFLTVVDGNTVSSPSIYLNNSSLSSNNIHMENCQSLNNGRQTVQNCSTITLDVNVDDLKQINTISVFNPSCTSPQTIQFGLVEKGTFISISPEFNCARNESTEVQLLGNGFLIVDNNPPTVFMNETQINILRWKECTQFPLPTHNILRCSEIDVQIPPLLSQTQNGPLQQTFQIIPPNLPECSITNDNFVVVAPSSINSITPNYICVREQNVVVSMSGSNFLEVNSLTPVITINDKVMTPTFSDCRPYTILGNLINVCTQVTLNLNASQFSTGYLSIAVQDPNPFNCRTTSNTLLYNMQVPVVTKVNPLSICSGPGTTTLSLTGSGYLNLTQVYLQNCVGQLFEPTLVAVQIKGTVLSVTESNLIVDFPNSLRIHPDHYQLLVSNGELCENTYPTSIEVQPKVFVFLENSIVLYLFWIPKLQLVVIGSDKDVASVKVDTSSVKNLTCSVVNTTRSEPNFVIVDCPIGLFDNLLRVEVTTVDGCIASTNLNVNLPLGRVFFWVAAILVLTAGSIIVFVGVSICRCPNCTSIGDPQSREGPDIINEVRERRENAYGTFPHSESEDKTSSFEKCVICQEAKATKILYPCEHRSCESCCRKRKLCTCETQIESWADIQPQESE